MTGFFWNIMLALVWSALTGKFTGPNLVTGFAFGYLALALVQREIPALNGYAERIPRLVGFVYYFVKELVVANWHVAYDVATPPLYMKPGVIGLPLQAKTDFEITLVASLISLTPGTLSLDVSDDRRTLYIHAMFMHDEAKLRRELHELEARLLKILR